MDLNYLQILAQKAAQKGASKDSIDAWTSFLGVAGQGSGAFSATSDAVKVAGATSSGSVGQSTIGAEGTHSEFMQQERECRQISLLSTLTPKQEVASMCQAEKI